MFATDTLYLVVVNEQTTLAVCATDLESESVLARPKEVQLNNDVPNRKLTSLHIYKL